MRGTRHGRIPLEAVMRLAILRLRGYRALLRGSQIAPVNVAILRFGIHDPWLDGIASRVKSVATVNHVPIFIGDAVARQRLARPAPAPAVLQAAANGVRLLRLHGHLVKVGDGYGVVEIPRSPAVGAPVDSAVAAGDNMIRVRRIDTHRVVIALDALHASRREFLSSVLGVEHLRAKLPN